LRVIKEPVGSPRRVPLEGLVEPPERP